ncbi:MAG TPA: carboxymuconolactone decarboxylase family protein [Polyangiaceae bacterium]|nr:carboxymuconolactone decarboxylase family protein [Polyangiaceae bacterium]
MNVARSRRCSRPEKAGRAPFALDNGVTQAELVEVITHLAFYVGWPSAVSAVNRAKALFAERDSK